MARVGSGALSRRPAGRAPDPGARPPLARVKPRDSRPADSPRPAAKLAPRHYAAWLAGILALALLYQLAVYLELARSPFFGNPILDARYQVEWAFSLASGHEPHAVFFQSPLYSYVLAAFLKVFGWNVWGLLCLQWAGMLAVAALVHETLRRLGVDQRILLASLAFTLFYPLFPYYASFFHKTALEILIHALVLYLAVLLVAETRSSRRTLAVAFAFGLVCGAAALVRSTFQLFLLLPCFLLPGRRVARIGLILLGFAGPVGWATVHNLRGAGEWVPLQSSFGFNLFLGNNLWNPEGALMAVPGLASKPLAEEAAAREYAEQQASRKLSVAGENDFYVRLVRDYIGTHPAQFYSALRHKFYWYVHREELPDNECYRCAADANLTLGANPLHWGWLMLLALPAMILLVAGWSWQRSVPRGELVALVYTLGLVAVTMVFFVNSRFRAGHVAPWLVVVALGLDVALRHWRAHRAAILVAVGLGVIPGAVMLTQPLLVYPPDEVPLKLCLIYSDLDQFDRAEAAALTLQSQKTRDAQLARIAALRLAPDDPGRERRLLGSVIPRRQRARPKPN